MFDWLKRLLRKNPPPEPGIAKGAGSPEEITGPERHGSKVELSVHGPAGARTENIDLVSQLAKALITAGREVIMINGRVSDVASGFEFSPHILSFEPLDDLSMRMSTLIDVSHPLIPVSFYEYQHSIGDTGELAVLDGFEKWAQLDLPVLLDSQREEPKDCLVMMMELPDRPLCRILLGPVSHLVTAPKSPGTESSEDGRHAPSCPCCLFTHSAVAFKSLLESGGFFALRLLAAKGPDEVSSDCRVNGEEYEAGKAALRAYAASWPDSGFRMCKQYVIIQRVEHAETAEKLALSINSACHAAPLIPQS